MLSSLAKVWLKCYQNIDWLLAIFRFLHVTFRKRFPPKYGEVTSGGGGGSSGGQLDENGNPVPVDESGTKPSGSAPNPVRNRKLCQFPDVPLPQNAIPDGRTAKGGNNRKTRTSGKAGLQHKPKPQKLKKVDIGARSSSSAELELAETSNDIKNQTQEYMVKEVVEPCVDDTEDEIYAAAVGGNSSAADDGVEDEKEEETILVNYEVPCSDSSNSIKFEEDEWSLKTAPQTEEKVSTGHSRSKKKRKKAKANKQSNLDSSVDTKKSLSPEQKIVVIESPFSHTSDMPLASFSDDISPSICMNPPSFKNDVFGGTRQKPSARVHPSRSVLDSPLTSIEIGCELGEKVSDILVSDDSKSDEMVRRMVSEQRELSVNCVRFKETDDTVVEEFKSQSSVELCTVLKSCEIAPTGVILADNGKTLLYEKHENSSENAVVLRKEQVHCETVNNQKAKVKPQSWVNPFSMVDNTSFSSKQQQHKQTVSPTSKSGVPTKQRTDSVVESKSRIADPPRNKPRSTVNPLNVGSPQSRPRLLHAKLDTVSSSDLVSQTNLHESRTTAAKEMNATPCDAHKKRNSREDRQSCSGSFVCDSYRGVPTDHFNSHCSGSTAHSRGYHGDASISSSCHGDIGHSTASVSSCPSTTHCLTSSKKLHASVKGNDSVCSHSVLEPGLIHLNSVRLSFPEVDRQVDNAINRPRTSAHGKDNRLRTKWGSSVNFQATFDLQRAQRFLHNEYIKTVDRKKRGRRDVVILTCD